MYIICWSLPVLSFVILVAGYDQFQIRVDELVDSGIKLDDLVCGEQTTDTL